MGLSSVNVVEKIIRRAFPAWIALVVLTAAPSVLAHPDPTQAGPGLSTRTKVALCALAVTGAAAFWAYQSFEALPPVATSFSQMGAKVTLAPTFDFFNEKFVIHDHAYQYGYLLLKRYPRSTVIELHGPNHQLLAVGKGDLGVWENRVEVFDANQNSIGSIEERIVGTGTQVKTAYSVFDSVQQTGAESHFRGLKADLPYAFQVPGPQTQPGQLAGEGHQGVLTRASSWAIPTTWNLSRPLEGGIDPRILVMVPVLITAAEMNRPVR